MKKLLLLLVLPFAVASCTFNINGGKTVKCKGPVETRVEQPEAFQAVELNGGFDVKMVDGPCGVKVVANNEAFDYLSIYTREDGTLVVETKDNAVIVADTCDIIISSDMFRKIAVNGAIDLDYAYARESTEPLTIEINGAGDMDIKNFNGPALSVTVNGAADMEISGLYTQDVSIAINGAGDVDIEGEADYVTLSVSGAGEIDASRLVTKNKPQITTAGLASVKAPQVVQ